MKGMAALNVDQRRGVEGVGDETVTRLINKIDDLSDRLARVETLLEEREKSKVNITGLLAWLITTAIAVYGVFHK